MPHISAFLYNAPFDGVNTSQRRRGIPAAPAYFDSVCLVINAMFAQHILDIFNVLIFRIRMTAIFNGFFQHRTDLFLG